jgi:hypothetical protein
MRKLIIACVAVLVYGSAVSQQMKHKKNEEFCIAIQYNHEFVIDGFVRVREWELQGDKMKLKDLGMTSYPAIQLYIEKYLKKKRTISLAYDHYFMRGTATFDRDITYNGTIIDGRQGIDVSPTVYFRISAMYAGPLLNKRRFDLLYKVGLVLDHITFYLDGVVVPTSPKTEVLEGFGRQAFPYPFLGLQGKIDLEHHNNINVEVSGTYIPKFESFYTEGGNVHLQYSNFQAAVDYSRTVSAFEIALGARFRYMHLFQESYEDTNIIETVIGGPFVKIACHF